MNKDQLHHLLMAHEEIKGRYIYSPLVSQWSEKVSEESFIQDLQKSVLMNKSLDIYIHVPFCHELCTFCGCNIQVTNSKEQNDSFVATILKEWNSLKSFIPSENIRSISIGGGTPTFLSPHLIEKLFLSIAPNSWKQIEIDPRYASDDHFKMFANVGLNRINVGIQDLNPNVLKVVNRNQSPLDIERIFNLALKNKIEETSVDLIFGLPKQDPRDAAHAINKLMQFGPDLVHLYPLAVLPWLQDSQRAYGHFELPSLDSKWMNYIEMRNALIENNYAHQGMGHYLKKDRKIYELALTKSISRQLMGILPFKFGPYLGLGPGSLSGTGQILSQNEKITEKYAYLVNKEGSARFNSHLQTAQERNRTKAYQELFVEHLSQHEHLSSHGKLTELGIELMKVVAQEI
ncbi:MAG: oxygen-independent coproporphyrinogen III oxidase [Bdellovibrio sp.]